jgi:hypothetical protein
MSLDFRKLRIDIINKEQLEIEIQAIEILIRKLERENVDKEELLKELREELEEKQNRLNQIG